MKMQKFFIGIASLLAPLLTLAGPVNINTADAETIASELTGIGLAKANAIVEYRRLNGDFDVPEELLKVKGIGPRVLAANQRDIHTDD
jgi:competence protein ComEA